MLRGFMAFDNLSYSDLQFDNQGNITDTQGMSGQTRRLIELLQEAGVQVSANGLDWANFSPLRLTMGTLLANNIQTSHDKDTRAAYQKLQSMMMFQNGEVKPYTWMYGQNGFMNTIDEDITSLLGKDQYATALMNLMKSEAQRPNWGETQNIMGVLGAYAERASKGIKGTFSENNRYLMSDLLGTEWTSGPVLH